MDYHLTIVRTESNPNYEQDMKAFEDRGRRFYESPNRDPREPQRDLVKNVLTVHLTEEQYRKVKAEALKAFE